MMFTTHVLAGLFLGGLYEFLVPGMSLVVVGGVAGFFPDMDMFFTHRRTLHRPFQYLALGVLTGLAVFFNPLFSILSVFLLSASLHSFMDVLSNGKTIRPWEREDDHAVYDHFRDEWMEPKRYMYDGSDRDLILANIFAVLNLFVFQFITTGVAGVLIGFSAVYTFYRERIGEQLSEYSRFSEFFHDLF